MRRRTPRSQRAVKTSVMKQAALGFRAHSGWAALVAVAGPPGRPAVIDRRRIEIADPEIYGSKQPYHAAVGWPSAKAEKYLRRCTNRTKLLARRAVRAAVADIRKRGYYPVGTGVLTASGRPLTTLATTLASHALIHTAEGELFRNALIQACEHCHLPVARVRVRELFDRGAAELGVPVDDLQGRLAGLGRLIGPPWGQDEKYAALVGWLALAAAVRRSDRRPRQAK